MNQTDFRCRAWIFALTVTALCALLCCPVALAETTPCAEATDANVTEVWPKDVQLGDVIVLQGEFKSLIAQSKCERKDIILYLDERPLKDLTAYPPSDPAGTVLKFPLKRTEQSREVWTFILGRPSWAPRSTRVSVGLVDRFAVPSNAVINLAVIPHLWFTFWLLLLLALLGLFLLLAYRSDLLRDPDQVMGQGEKKRFSLARTQAAWWFFLVLASYLFIGIITGDFSTTITATVLGLIGISAGTVVSSAMIDASKNTPAAAATKTAAIQEIQARVEELKLDVSTADLELAANPKNAAAASGKTLTSQELEQRESQLKKLKNQSENPARDICSDANGVTFHRFQIATWTLVLGIIFITQVYRVLAMPEFNGSLLALLGISAGTFVVVKTQEPTVPK